MGDSTVPAFFDTFKARLEARPFFANIDVYTGEPGEQGKGKELVVLVGAEIDQEHAFLGPGGVQDEDYHVLGYVRSHKRGKGEKVIKAARDRAYAIRNDVDACLKEDPTVGEVVGMAWTSDSAFRQGAETEGRWARVSFRIHVKAWP